MGLEFNQEQVKKLLADHGITTLDDLAAYVAEAATETEASARPNISLQRPEEQAAAFCCICYLK